MGVDDDKTIGAPLRPGYALQSFFAAADKKSISAPIPGASIPAVLCK